MSDVTQILERVEKGDGKAAEELPPLVYGELRNWPLKRWLANNPDRVCSRS
jgi:hypothetical protein